MRWREERRADRAAEREQDRLDRQAERQASAEAEQARAQAEAVRTRADVEARQAQREQVEAARDRRRQARAARLTALRGWAGAHAVELLVYPLAVVSALVAIPAMAGYGAQVYETGTGWALPALTELGMWAFALAVQVSRTRHPERPVWSLQTGVWAFAGVALLLNALHGITTGGLDAAVVMGVASVAGVAAHQLVTASPRTAPAERAAAARERRERRKRSRIEALATRQAVAELDTDGRARLVYRAGLVTVAPRWFRRARLVEAVVPGRAVTPAGDAWDAALAALTEPDVPGAQPEAAEGVSGVSVAGQDATAVAVADPDETGADTSETPGQTDELAALLAAAREAIAAGELPSAPSQRQVRETLGIRASRAGQVQRALRETDRQ